jgi:hypothetical protein
LRSALGREFGVVGKQFLCLSGVALSTNIAQIELYELDLRAHLNDSIRSSQKVSVACPDLQYQHSLQAIGNIGASEPTQQGFAASVDFLQHGSSGAAQKFVYWEWDEGKHPPSLQMTWDLWHRSPYLRQPVGLATKQIEVWKAKYAETRRAMQWLLDQ